MKKIFTIAAAMLFAATTMWANHGTSTTDGMTTETWDFAEYSTAVNLGTGETSVYDGLTFYGGGGSNKEQLTTGGFKFQGTTQQWNSVWGRYIAYTPVYGGTITINVKGNGGSAGRYVFLATVIKKFSAAPTTGDGVLAVSIDLGNGTAAQTDQIVYNLTAGTTYYIEAYGGVQVNSISYKYSASGKTPLSAEWSAASFDLNEDASAKLPVFTVSGGSAALGTDYSVAYTKVADESNIVTLDAANGITAINTAAEATATVRATVTLLNTEDYTLAVTEYNCEISVVKPTCAAPVITFKGYNYEQGKYEFSATCATEGAKLSYRLKGEEDYLPYTAGESFFVVGTGNSNDKVIVKATKSGYNEKATTTAYYLNAAPAAASPEALIPFLLGNDDSFKNHAYKYKSVTIGEENAASTVGGTADANTLKLRTNQSGNTLTLYVNEGYKVTNVTITGKTNNTDATKVVKVAGLAIDGEEKEAWTGKDVVFPISSAEAIACSTGAISAASTIKFTFAAGGTGSMHTQLIASIVVTYENGTATAIENIENTNKAVKFMENGQLFILRDGKVFNITGARVK